MNYKHNYDYCLADKLGDSGLDSAEFEVLMGRADECINGFSEGSHRDVQTLLDLVRTCDDLEELEPIAERYCESFDHVIVLGTGGSSLGGKTLSALAPLPFFNNPSGFLGRPNLYFWRILIQIVLSASFDKSRQNVPVYL